MACCKTNRKFIYAIFDIDYYYENHYDNRKPLFKIIGVVKEIKALYKQYENHISP